MQIDLKEDKNKSHFKAVVKEQGAGSENQRTRNRLPDRDFDQ
jgi:hypothetical protein